MSDRKLRWLGLGLVATAGAGVLGLTAMMNPAVAHADGEDIGLVIGASGVPIPGAVYVAAADEQYLDNPFTHSTPTSRSTGPPQPCPPTWFLWQGRLYAGGALSADRRRRPPIVFELPHRCRWLSGPELIGGPRHGHPGEHDRRRPGSRRRYQRCSATRRAPQSPATSCSNSTPAARRKPDPWTLSSCWSLTPAIPTAGRSSASPASKRHRATPVSDPLNLPSLGFVFDSATPSDDYVTNIYSLEYDGFADFPRYPLNFLSDLNAFLGIATLHGTYLNGFEPGDGGPTAEADRQRDSAAGLGGLAAPRTASPTTT